MLRERQAQTATRPGRLRWFEEVVQAGMLAPEMAEFLSLAVQGGLNVLVSGDVDEVWGGAADRPRVMDAGSDDSLNRVNAPDDALQRLEQTIANSEDEARLPEFLTRQEVNFPLQVLVHISRLSTGERKVTRIAELCGSEDGAYTVEDIFVHRAYGVDASGRVQGAFYATGYEPALLGRLTASGGEASPALFSPRELSEAMPAGIAAAQIYGEKDRDRSEATSPLYSEHAAEIEPKQPLRPNGPEPVPPPPAQADATPPAEANDFIFGAITPVLAACLPESSARREELQAELQIAGYTQPHAWQNLAAIRYVGLMAPLLFFGLLLVLVPTHLEAAIAAMLVIFSSLGWSLPRRYVRRQAVQAGGRVE